jgi:hypothetical protein
MEQRGVDVLVIEDIPADLLGRTAQMIWAKVEKQEYKEVSRIEPKQKDNKTEPSRENDKE